LKPESEETQLLGSFISPEFCEQELVAGFVEPAEPAAGLGAGLGAESINKIR